MDFKIKQFDTNKDTHQIYLWDALLLKTEGYRNIRKFILESNKNECIYELLSEYASTKDSPYEKLRVFCAKTNDDEIVGIIAARLADWDMEQSLLHISYVIVNPTYQGQHIGTRMLKELLCNPKKYLGYSPATISAVINTTNIPSKKMFENLGFDLKLLNDQFFAKAKLEEIQKNLNQKQPGN